jgi:hypothetical protein
MTRLTLGAKSVRLDDGDSVAFAKLDVAKLDVA